MHRHQRSGSGVKILALETATIVCGAAVVEHDDVRAVREVAERNVHAENIMRLIDEVLHDAACPPSAVDAIAISAGPGSFTGLRIGFSVAKGLAYALDKKLIAIPTLHALAFRAVQSGTVKEEFVVAAIDARRDEVYCSCYRTADLNPMWENEDLTLEELGRRVRNKQFAVTGDAQQKVATQAGGIVVAMPFSQCSAASVALLAGSAARAGNFADPAAAEPLYVKEFYTTANQHAG